MQSYSIRETGSTYFQVWPFTLAEWIEAEEMFLRSEGHATLVEEQKESILPETIQLDRSKLLIFRR